MNDMDHMNDTSESSPVEYLKFILVLVAITLLSWALYQNSDQTEFTEWMRYFMGVFMIIFASFKLVGYKMFVEMFQGYDLVAKRTKLYANIYPFLELLLGLSFLFDLLPTVRSAIVIGVMGIGAVGVFQEIFHRRSGIHCACLGNIIKLPLSTVSLVENVLMVAMATAVLFFI